MLTTINFIASKEKSSVILRNGCKVNLKTFFYLLDNRQLEKVWPSNQGIKLTVTTFLYFACKIHEYLCSTGVEQKCIIHEMGISSSTAVDWDNFLREVCEEVMLKQSGAIGGPGKVV